MGLYGKLLASSHARAQTHRTESEARKSFQRWVGQTRQPNALICVETDSVDIVWDDRGSRDLCEPTGTTRAWAVFEGIPVKLCPGHPNYFVLLPRTADEAFAICMRWH